MSKAYKGKTPTEREFRLLLYIIRYKTRTGGHSPSYRDMQTAIGPVSTSVLRYNLLRLHINGYVILKNGVGPGGGGKNIQINLPGEKYTVNLPYDIATLDPRQLRLPTVGE